MNAERSQLKQILEDPGTLSSWSMEKICRCPFDSDCRTELAVLIAKEYAGQGVTVDSLGDYACEKLIV